MCMFRNVHVYRPDIPVSSVWATIQFTPLVLEHILLTVSREFSSFSIAKANHYCSAYFGPSGTHPCWVDRSSMDAVFLTLLYMKSRGIKPQTFLIFGSSALSTLLHAPNPRDHDGSVTVQGKGCWNAAVFVQKMCQ